VGSNFLISNLFFNVPARRKFLKSNTTELNNILTAFERIALVNPSVSFTLRSNGTELFNLRSSNQRQRIIDIFGKRLNQDLLPLGVETSMCNISGFVGKPESARKKGAQQCFFVNGRYMKHPYFHKAVISAFERLVPVGEQVPYFIYFQVPAADIDVNIHPTKTEIKFENELAIWQILQAAVKEAVGLFSEVPAIDFDTQGKPDIPVFDPSTTVSPSAPKVSYNPQYNPFNAHAQQPRPKMTDDWKKLYDDLLVQPTNPQQEIFETSQASSSPVSIIADKSPVHYQYKGQYIMTAVKSGLMVIDQHRAHVRILYEEYLKRQSAKQWASQKLLFPEMVQFSTSEQLTFTSIMEQMTEMGFEMTDLGSGCYAINAIPVGLDGLSPVNLVKDMVDAAREKGTAIKDEVERTLALSMARNAAIPHGQVLGNEEMENIVNSLFACTNVNYTPDGKSILGILKQADIEHLLGG
jgi:DNA mismatch repair protein MutL